MLQMMTDEELIIKNNVHTFKVTAVDVIILKNNDPQRFLILLKTFRATFIHCSQKSLTTMNRKLPQTITVFWS